MENLGVSRESVAIFNRIRRLIKDEFGVDLRLAQPNIVAQAKHYLSLTQNDSCRSQLEKWLQHVEMTNSHSFERYSGDAPKIDALGQQGVDDKPEGGKRSLKRRIIYRGRVLFK